MNHTPRPPAPSEQRLQRLSLWLALTVAWFAAHLLALVAPHMAARVLAEYARHTRMLLVGRALKRVTWRAKGRSKIPSEIRRLTCRRVAGARIRRALRAGTRAQRARAICDALAAPERWIAHIIRRLKRGFTKLRRLPAPRRTRSIAPAFAPLMARAINSS